MLLAHDGDQLLHVVRVGGVRKDVLRRVKADRVLVAPEDVDCVPADAQARPRDETCVDRIAHGGVGGARAFGAHVALGRETGQQIRARGENRANRARRD